MNRKILLLFISLLTYPAIIYSQPSLPSDVKMVFDSVKTIYGVPCSIGVNSILIQKLEKYKNYRSINNYLDQYYQIKDTIDVFRLKNIKDLENDAVLLRIDRIFKDSLNRNIINLCGIYYGSDSVNNLIMTYTIVHNFINNYYINGIQIANFDKVLRNELLQTGKAWYYSEKLKMLKGFPGSKN